MCTTHGFGILMLQCQQLLFKNVKVKNYMIQVKLDPNIIPLKRNVST